MNPTTRYILLTLRRIAAAIAIAVVIVIVSPNLRAEPFAFFIEYHTAGQPTRYEITLNLHEHITEDKALIERLAPHLNNPQSLNQIIQLRVGDQADLTLPPILATVRATESGQSFMLNPRFTLQPSQKYTLTLTLPPDTKPAFTRTLTTTNPAAKLPPTSVTAVYPSSDQLPENLIRFYIHFSQPMSRGDVYKHITLLDANNNPIPDVFLELPQELWDPTGTRLTLFFHPGRVKQGLVPNQEMGPTLIAGNNYTLRIDTGLIDANNRPLAQPFTKPFTATPADQQQPNPASWQVHGPLHRTNEPLTINLSQPLDHAMLLRVVEILDPQLNPMPGTIETADNESTLIFRPEQSWRPGNYTIRISNTLEDPSGNNIAERFELPAADASPDATQRGHTDLHISITE